MVVRREEREVRSFIAGVALDQVPFVWPRYQGFEVRTTTIRLGAEKYPLLEAAFENRRRQTLTITSPDEPGEGGMISQDYDVRVVSLTRETDGTTLLVLADSRKDLELAVMPFDINLPYGSIRSGGGIENRDVARSRRIYQAGTSPFFNEPHTLRNMLSRLQEALTTVDPNGGPELLGVKFEVSGNIGLQVGEDGQVSQDAQGEDKEIPLRNSIYSGRKNVLTSLAAILTELSLSMFVKPDGTIVIVDATPTDQVLEQLEGIRFRLPPPWREENRLQLGKPQRVIGLYTRLRQFNIEFESETIEDTSSIRPPTAKSEQVYPTLDDNYGTIEDLLNSHNVLLTADTTNEELTDAEIARQIIGATWEGTAIQQYASVDGTSFDELVAGLSEPARVVFARKILPTIEANWRSLFRVDLWDAPSSPRDWLFGQFDDEGVFQERAVKMNYVDFFTKPQLRSENVGFPNLDDVRRTQSYNFQEAPFVVAWDGHKGLEQGVLRIVPQPAQGIRDRRAGALNREDVLVAITESRKLRGTEFSGKFSRVTWASRTGYAPEFTPDFRIQVSVVIPDRRPIEGGPPYSAYYEVVHELFENGDVPRFYVQMDDRITANFRDQEEEPLNLEALRDDLAERAKAVRAFFDRRRAGQDLAHSQQMGDILAEQAIQEANIEVHTQGIGTVFTNVVLGVSKRRYSGIQRNNPPLVEREQRERSVAGADIREEKEEPGADLPVV